MLFGKLGNFLGKKLKLRYNTSMPTLSFPHEEEAFNKFLVNEYFRYGSVDGVLKKYHWGLPISYANYQRVLSKWGVVKKAGPNNLLSESLEFLTHFAHDNLSLEDLYKKMPPSFQTSVSSLYRVMQYVKEGITRRVGVALIVTPYDLQQQILVAKDVSNPRIELGKPFGSLSLPMGYSRKRDSRKLGIKRILQNEVFTRLTVEKLLPDNIIPENPEPFMYLDIADVRVSVYHLSLPKELCRLSNFSSYKLKDYKFVNLSNLIDDAAGYRVGVKEAATGFKKYLSLTKRNISANPIQAKSILNKNLAVVQVEAEL